MRNSVHVVRERMEWKGKKIEWPWKQYISQFETWDNANSIGFDTFSRKNKNDLPQSKGKQNSKETAFKVDNNKIASTYIRDILNFFSVYFQLNSWFMVKNPLAMAFGEIEAFKPILRVFDLYFVEKNKRIQNTLFSCALRIWCLWKKVGNRYDA